MLIMGELFFRPKEGGEWKPLAIAEPLDSAFLSYANEPKCVFAQNKPTTFTFIAKTKATPEMRRFFARFMRNQKIYERRVLRKWQEQWNKRHSL
jgi:hypothetical protein